LIDKEIIMTENIVRAEQVVRDLVQKRDKAAAQVELIAQQRKSIGYSVFVDADRGSRKKLDELNLSSATLSGELEALEAAISEAKSRLTAAKEAKARAADETRGRALLEIADQFDAEAHKLGDATRALVAACTAIAALHTKAYGLGAQRPIRKQVDIMVARVVTTAIMQTGLQEQVGTAFLAPDERRTADVLLSYGRIRARAAQLGS
jgi:outer membrane murein-binding lipoprotein Lpp